MLKVTELDFMDDYATTILTLSDGRTAYVPTDDLLPGNAARNGDVVIENTEGPGNWSWEREEYMHGRLEKHEYDLAEYVDNLEILTPAVQSLAKQSGLEWHIAGRRLSYQREHKTETVLAANHGDLLYLLQSWAEVVSVNRGVVQLPKQQPAALVA